MQAQDKSLGVLHPPVTPLQQHPHLVPLPAGHRDLGTGPGPGGIPVSVQGKSSLGWCRDLDRHRFASPIPGTGLRTVLAAPSRPDAFHLLVPAKVLQLDDLLMAFSARCHLEGQEQLLPVGEGLSLCLITHGPRFLPH